MPRLTVSNKLQGDYGELVFEHYCKKHSYAYITLEEIYHNLTPRNILHFRFGYQRVKIKIPDKIIAELHRICKPSNEKDESPSFVYDYLTVSLINRTYFERIGEKIIQKNQNLAPSNFQWIEVKTGKSKLSPNQQKMKNDISLSLCVFRIDTELPKSIGVKWKRETAYKI